MTQIKMLFDFYLALGIIFVRGKIWPSKDEPGLPAYRNWLWGPKK